MKKWLLIMTTILFLTSSAFAGYFCTAEANCGNVAIVYVPTGGSCWTFEGGVAVAKAYDASGALVAIDRAFCPY